MLILFCVGVISFWLVCLSILTKLNEVVSSSGRNVTDLFASFGSLNASLLSITEVGSASTTTHPRTVEVLKPILYLLANHCYLKHWMACYYSIIVGSMILVFGSKLSKITGFLMRLH